MDAGALRLIGVMIMVILLLFLSISVAKSSFGDLLGISSKAEFQALECEKIGAAINAKYLPKNSNFCYKSAFTDNFGTCPYSTEEGIYNAERAGNNYLSVTQDVDGVGCCVYAIKGSNCDGVDGVDLSAATIPLNSFRLSKSIDLNTGFVAVGKVSGTESTFMKSDISFSYGGETFYFGYLSKTPSSLAGAEFVFGIINGDTFTIPLRLIELSGDSKKVWSVRTDTVKTDNSKKVANSLSGKVIVEGSSSFYNTKEEALS